MDQGIKNAAKAAQTAKGIDEPSPAEPRRDETRRDGPMACNQTCHRTCNLTCAAICSVPNLNPLPFAVLAAAVIGFLVGRLVSSSASGRSDVWRYAAWGVSAEHGEAMGRRLEAPLPGGRAGGEDVAAAEEESEWHPAEDDGEGQLEARDNVRFVEVRETESPGGGGLAEQLQPGEIVSTLLVEDQGSRGLDVLVEPQVPGFGLLTISTNVMTLPTQKSPGSSASTRSSLRDRPALMDPQGRRQAPSPSVSNASRPATPCSGRRSSPCSSDGSHFSFAASDSVPDTPSGRRKPLPVSIPSPFGMSVASSEPLLEGDEGDTVSPRETGEGRDEDPSSLPAAPWMCGVDAARGTLQCGLSWLDLVEPCLEDVYGENWVESVHPEDVEKAKDAVFSASSVRGSFQVQYRLQVTTGSYRWVMDLGKPRFSSNDQTFLGYVGWRIDINESKMIELDYEKYWSLPYEILVKAGADGRFFENVTPSLPRMLGYDYDEFIKTEWLSFVHPDDKEYTMNEFKKLADHEVISDVVMRYRCNPAAKIEGPCFTDSTGTYKWISWTANHLFGAGRDISHEKAIQQELQRSQEELRRLTDAIPGGVFQYRVDDDGVQTFPFISEGAMHMYSYLTEGSSPKSDGPNSSLDDVNKEMDHYGFQNQGDDKKSRLRVHPEDWPKLKEAMTQSGKLGTSLDFDYRLIGGDEVRWIRVHAVPLAQRGDGSQDWCGITWDMTDQRNAEAALRAERDNAEKSSQAKGAFLANMSHEIRTPMNAVIGMGALLLETDLNEEQRDYVSTIRSSGEALLGIINDILDFSKIEAGKMDLEVTAFDMCDCIEDTLDLITPQAAAKGIEMTYSICETVPTKVYGDVGRLRQILVNLLSNAVKFTPQGSVSISVDGHQLPSTTEDKAEECEDRTGGSQSPFNSQAQAAATGGKWELHVAVKDTGIGIPDNRKHALFQAFSQVDASTTRRYGGTGLGLAICARLCSLMGGRIWVESTHSEGSTFHFTFVTTAVEISETSEQDASATCLLNKRVLIISTSNSSTQTMCMRFLKSWQAQAVAANTIDDAVRLLQATWEASGASSTDAEGSVSFSYAGFDVVIVDSEMLDVDDTKLLDCLRMINDSKSKVAVILLTPFGRRPYDYKGHCGFEFHAHVAKPVKASMLLNALMTILARDSEASSDVDKKQVAPVCPIKSRNKRGLNVQSSTPVNGETHPLRILIAEDNVINQKVLSRLLLKYGYTADVVANGLEAVDAAIRQRYDVILMDCFMPEMDGLEATKKIRQKVRPCPVIVAVTAAALEDERQACMHAGMHMYIAKPIQAEYLVSVLLKCWQVKDERLDPDFLQTVSFDSKQKYSKHLTS